MTNRGYTIIEVLITIVFVVITALIVHPILVAVQNKSERDFMVQQFEEIKEKQSVYKEEHGRYAEHLQLIGQHLKVDGFYTPEVVSATDSGYTVKAFGKLRLKRYREMGVSCSELTMQVTGDIVVFTPIECFKEVTKDD